MGELRERPDVGDAQQRVRHRLDVQERRRRLAERGLDPAVVGRVDEDDLRAALADPALEQRADLTVDVLLRDDASAGRDRAGIDERRDRCHPRNEARRGRGALELGERHLEGGGRRRAVAPVHKAGAVTREDLVLRGRGAVIEGHALHERRRDRDAFAGGERARGPHDARADAYFLLDPHRPRV